MASIVLRVLDGADRGRVFEDLQTPVTIGREEGNSIQLNDERVSRFHLKIQEDREKIVLTDLESTNGTKVNGEDVQLRILRYGDLIAVGRSVILFGSREQIGRRMVELGGVAPPATDSLGKGDFSSGLSDSAQDFELAWAASQDAQNTLHMLQPPELPEGLSPGQKAELSELLGYLHIRIRELIASATPAEKQGDSQMVLDIAKWQTLLDLQSRLASYLRSIGDPDHE